MAAKHLRVSLLAAVMSISVTESASAQTVPPMEEGLPTYADLKRLCLNQYGYFGRTPLDITKFAASSGLGKLTEIVEENIEPWWAYWWEWTPPDNEVKVQELAEYFRMFRVCDIDGSLTFFADLSDVEATNQLSAAASEQLRTELEYLGNRTDD